MKYRIKIVTYKTGRIAYFAEAKWMLFWVGIGHKGEASIAYDGETYSRKEALDRIDAHYAGNTKKQTIQFEYVQK